MYQGSIYDRISQRREAQEKLERERLEEEARKPPPPERYLTNELSFVRPEGLRDKTFHVFTLTEHTPSPFSLVLGRTLAGQDASLEHLAKKLLGEMEKTLPHLQWQEPLAPIEVGGIEARRAAFRWRQQGQLVHQIQVMFLHRDEHGQRLFMQLTATSNSVKGMTEVERVAFDEVLNSLQLRSPPDSTTETGKVTPA
ncbi:DcrB-related protein [Pseudomonas sp. PSKL.D1]|uniref:DcrB-related protein n=1 Tax=Pseudomonas sp. PSKL.D1 TaxID=3029060 RepID=UPI00238141F9|nr:DcrB-related protein [Pseudomonas sp. PSKL.D1]WDY55721.1 DcrB-related protein [Pseudomonas sp. PSKL.D1]